MKTMETQSDQEIRVVSLSNLRAMCERVSGTCHRYSVVKVSRSRVHVEYSNPDEYAREQPMVAVFPALPGWTSDDGDNPRVVLDIMRVIYDRDNGEGWQAFQPLLDCPTLWRGIDGANWESHAEIRARDADRRLNLSDTCTVCDQYCGECDQMGCTHDGYDQSKVNE